MGLIVSRQPSKKQLLLAVKRSQSFSNLTISSAYLGLLALEESLELVQLVSMSFPLI